MSLIIEVSDLTRSFGDFVAVSHVNFEVSQGEIFGYLGANGAGKSTTIRMLCGLLNPTSGVARVNGHDVGRDPEAVKSSIGYMSQKFSLYLDLPVQSNLEFFAGAYGIERKRARRRIDEILDLVNLSDKRDIVTGSLPGGIRQRLALGSALLHEPRLVFLDEPTAGVDPASRREFWRLIRNLSEQGVTVFVTTHYMDEAEYCNRIGLMVAGKLVALDTPAALKRDLVPGKMLLVHGVGLDAALGSLKGLDSVVEIQPFGNAAHVRLAAPDAPTDPVLAALARAGASDVHFEVIQPSLEDVFLSVVRDEAQSPETSPETSP